MADPPHHSYSTTPTHYSTMAYQYQIATPGLESSNMPVMSGYGNHPMEHLRSISPSNAQGLPSSSLNLDASSMSKIKDSKTKRSMSTPNITGIPNTDPNVMALVNDKRRNKLGYHRTSVACGHCRRRKIRCIPASGDPQNRCSNCIRLKKDCNYFPVDQQPQPEPKRRSSKTQSGSGQSPESTSPPVSSGQLPDMQADLPYQHLIMPPIQDLEVAQVKREGAESFSPESKVTSSRNFEYNQGHTNWMAAEISPNTKTPAEMSGSYWRVNPQDSPMTPTFSPYTAASVHIPNSQNWPTQAPQAPPESREGGWSTPQRSISYGNLEGLHSNQYPAYASGHPLPAQAEQYASRPRQHHPGMYPPPISTAANSAISVPETSPASNIGTPHAQSAGPMTSGSYSSWNQQYAYQKASPVSSNVEPYGTWNANHGGQQHIPEEAQTGNSAGYAGYGSAGNGMYYAGQQQPRR